MAYNAYELRLQLFEKAKEFVWEKFNRDVLEWDRISQNRAEIKEKYAIDFPINEKTIFRPIK